MKIGVVDFPGPNTVNEIRQVCRMFGHQLEVYGPRSMNFKDIDALILPGGYSFGDAIRPAAIAKTCQVCGAIGRFADSDKPLLGLGNGFQLLCEIGVLPGMLMRNTSLEFAAGFVGVRVENTESPFTERLEQGTCLKLPLACYYGQYYVDFRRLKEFERTGRIAFRYVDRFGYADAKELYLGSQGNIAGLYNEKGNVLGMMTHPERALDGADGQSDGLKFFESWFGEIKKEQGVVKEFRPPKRDLKPV